MSAYDAMVFGCCIGTVIAIIVGIILHLVFTFISHKDDDDYYSEEP